MEKYLLQYRGPMDHYKDDLGRIYSSEGMQVLDASSSEMGLLLVEGDGDALQKLVESMPGWRAYPQHYYQLPEQRPEVKQGPEVKATPSPNTEYQGEQRLEAAPPLPQTDPSQKSKPPPKAQKPKRRKKSK
jgi:hypothetical protein